MENSSVDGFYEIDLPQNKCCHMGYLFDNNYRCVLTLDDNSYGVHNHTEEKFREMDYKCPDDDYSTVYSIALENATLSLCSDMMLNGTEIFVSCSENDNRTKVDSGITTIIMWGTQTYMSTNIAHIILCLIVVTMYYFIPEMRKGLHNRAVLRHYLSLMCLGISLGSLGYLNLCGCSVSDTLLSCIWLTLQYFTLATVFWLNVICYDMTLVITRFEWLRSIQDDNRKLLNYGILAWGVAFVPVLFAATFEFIPGLTTDFILKPNYTAYRGERRWIVNYYFFFLPTLTLLCNNALFIYTTYKMIRINRSTKIATGNRSNALKNYIIFLRLYLLMGAPWFFGCLFAFLHNELIILKFCRVLQPALWIIILLSDKKLRKRIVQKMCLKG